VNFPGITVVIPTFNNASTLDRAIDSVLMQEYPAFELIVVDDGSTDETRELLNSRNDAQLLVVRQENRGVCAARNAGTRRAHYGTVTFLDADDEALPGWLHYFGTASAGGAQLAACATRFVGSTVDKRVVLEPGGAEFAGLPTPLLAGTFCIDRELLDAVGGFREGLTFGEHADLGLRLGGHLRATAANWSISNQVLVRAHRSDRATDPERLLESALTILAENEQQLARRPAALASYHAIAGVNAQRLGRRSLARHHLWRAVALGRRDISVAARLAAASIRLPGVGTAAV
jgi:glycosyltransferase involved in cell wall biosynthesis